MTRFGRQFLVTTSAALRMGRVDDVITSSEGEGGSLIVVADKRSRYLLSRKLRDSPSWRLGQ